MLMKWLPVAILITGLAYIFVIPEEPLFMNITCKVIPILWILLYASKTGERGNRYQIAILLGLFFCMLGDGLLIWFLIGLSAFLIGHHRIIF